MSDDVRLHLGSCTDILPTLPDASVDCVITDPPYPEIDRDYGRMSEPEWHAMMDVVVEECRRVLKPHGSAVFILQPNSERVGRMRPWLWEFMAKWTREWGMVQDAWWWNISAMPSAGATTGGLLRGSLKACVWMGSAQCHRDQSGVLWSESEENAIRRNGKRARMGYVDDSPSGYEVDRHRMHAAAERRGGVTPFNVIPAPGVNNHRGGGFGHGAATPLQVVDWWVRYICPPGGTVLDPFIGSGTVGLAAINRGCGIVGIERMPKYFAIAQDRIAKAQAAKSEQLIPA